MFTIHFYDGEPMSYKDATSAMIAAYGDEQFNIITNVSGSMISLRELEEIVADKEDLPC